MAVDLVKPPGAAAMRASAEMQQTTIGGDSDVDGSERPRRRRTRGRGPKGRAKRKAVAGEAAAAAATGNDECRINKVTTGATATTTAIATRDGAMETKAMAAMKRTTCNDQDIRGEGERQKRVGDEA